MKTKQMKQRLQEKWLKTLGKFPWLPGVGQLKGGFSPVLKDHDAVVGEEEEQEGEWGRRRGEGMGGTWVAKGAVQLDICDASTGFECQGGFTILGPD